MKIVIDHIISYNNNDSPDMWEKYNNHAESVKGFD